MLKLLFGSTKGAGGKVSYLTITYKKSHMASRVSFVWSGLGVGNRSGERRESICAWGGCVDGVRITS